MNRQEKLAAVIAVLAALWVGTLADARPPEADDDVKRQLKEMKDELDTLKRRVELDRQVMKDRLGDLDMKLDRILDQLSRGSTRRAGSIDPAPLRTGTIRLDNRLGVPAQVTIDGVLHTVPPLTTRVLRDQPAGSFLYDVTAEGFGITAQRRRTLPANETWTLTIY